METHNWLRSKWDIYLHHIPSLKGPAIITDEDAERVWAPDRSFWTRQDSCACWLTTAVTACTGSSQTKAPVWRAKVFRKAHYWAASGNWRLLGEGESVFLREKLLTHRRWPCTHVYTGSFKETTKVKNKRTNWIERDSGRRYRRMRERNENRWLDENVSCACIIFSISNKTK